MMIKTIEDAVNGIGQRKILFVIGEHLSGKTQMLNGFLIDRYGEENLDKHYEDVGLYIMNKVTKGYIDTYKVYPGEFKEDADDFFKELVEDKYKDCNLVVFDHMEFLLSENYTGWLKILGMKTMEENTAIVVVPIDYKDSIPLGSYKYIEL